MKQLFRWPGLIAFVVIVALLAAFWWLLADTIVKQGIEKTGSRMVGAQVNLDRADISLDPLQVRLVRLQVTDPEQPMRNMVEVGEAVANLESWKLLMGQVIINELSVTRLQLDTPRRRSGALKRAPKAERADAKETARALAASAMEKMQITPPSVKSVLGREELLITSRTRALKETHQQEQAKLDALIAKLPDETARQQYRQRFNKATEGKPRSLEEFKQRKETLEQLQRELKELRQTLIQTREQVKSSRQTISERLAALKAAPREDWNRLRKKYSLNTEGALNVSRLLFGEKVNHWAAEALGWYRKLQPLLASEQEADEKKIKRAAGRFIHFPSSDPTPDFLLRKAQIQASLPMGNIDGELKDLTHQPAVIGRPATLKASAEQLKGMQGLSLDATFDHISAERARDEVHLRLKGVVVDRLRLSGDDDFPLSLANALTDIDGNMTLRQGIVDARFKGAFSNARFASDVKEGLAGELAKALAGIDRFTIEGEASGRLSEPHVSLRSDLDKRLSAAFRKRLRARQEAFEKELRSELEQRISGPRSEYEGQLQQLKGLENEIDGQLDEYQRMLKAQVADYQEQAKEKLEEKSRQELEQKLKGLKF